MSKNALNFCNNRKRDFLRRLRTEIEPRWSKEASVNRYADFEQIV